MSMMREEIVFGPIYSRRLGSSLGINLLPEKGKLCNFDCIYCECGWNADGREDRHIPDAEALRVALDAKLRECRESGAAIDSITFSGDGEPTLNPDFAEIIDITIALRDRYYPDARVSVLTNATRLHRDSVREALMKVDNPILKLDAPTTRLAEKINCPQGDYEVARVVEDMKLFNGDFVLQTMFLRSSDFDSSSPEVLEGWMDIVRDLRPREIMVYTIARPTPQKDLQKFTEAQMRTLVQPLVDEGFNIKIYE
ncbi:MAG: radical SAM protein [Bacteroidales bacterium]|nr:radical SAM protein [Candidatus Cryptobacteroides onthequi]